MFLHSRSLLLSSSLILILGLAGCTDPKIAQCDQLMEVVEQGHLKIESKKDQKDQQATRELSEDLKTVVQNIKAVSLEDQTLQSLQQQFAQTFQELSQALGEISLALETANQAEVSVVGRQTLKNAKTKIVTMGETAHKITNTQDALVDELIIYCQN